MENILPLLERYKQSFTTYKLPIILAFLGLVLIIGGVFASALTKDTKVYPKESIIEGQKLISVDVSGAVNNPGVYTLAESSRVENAVNAAGGFSQDSNQEYISKYINMAQKLSDGSKIYVPVAGETVPIPQTGQVAGTNTLAKININAASQSELETLSGVGPVTASKIISGRPYQKVEELLDKKIVGKATFEKIKDSIVIY